MCVARLYLDFDGVLNAKEPAHALVEAFDIPIEGSPYLAPVSRIVFSPTVIERLESFRVKYGVELVWLSTWNDRKDVLKLSEYLRGLHGGRVIEARLNPEAKDKHEWTQWKADAILEDQRMDSKPFVWVDDNAHRFHGDAVAMELTHADHLFLTPVSLTGLTVADLDQMEAFYAERANV